MVSIVNRVEINRPPADVFDYVTDPSRFKEWQDAVVSATPQGSGAQTQGSRILLTRKTGPSTQTMTSELTAYNPPHDYAFRVVDGPVRAVGKGTFEPLDGGARTAFTFELDFEGHGIGKLLIPLVVRRSAMKELERSHAALKRRLDSQATSGAAPT